MSEARERPHYHRIRIHAADHMVCIVYTGNANIFVDTRPFEVAIADVGHSYDILTKG